MDILTSGILTNKDMQELNALSRRDVKKLSSILQESFSNALCPFSLAVKMLRGTQNKKKPRSLCDNIVEALKIWTREHPQYDVPMEVKRQVVPLVCDFIKANSKALVFLFQVDKPNLSLVEEFIYRFNQERAFTKMVFLIATLNLQCPAYTSQYIVPMLVQGENFLTEKYMQGSIGAQRGILSLVDTWLANSFPIEEFRNVSGAFIKHKALRKLLTRWQEMFPQAGIDLPNLRRLKAVGQIRFFLLRYYRETSMSARALEDLVHKYIDNDRDMVQSVCKMVHGEFGDSHRARKLQQRYNRRRGNNNAVEVWSDSEDDDRDADFYLPLKVDFDRVLMVDSLEKLSACEQDLHNMEGFATGDECKLVGFDAEWSNDSLALVQLAVFDKVYLVDVYKFRNMKLTGELAAFIGRLFTSKRLLKLGFGVQSDLTLLRREFKACMPDKPSKLLDLIQLRDAHRRYKLLPENPLEMAHDHCGKKLTGLSRIVYQTLGKPLDKREQISDWERRPLHRKQAIYAATDAYCLLQVYQELDKRLTESGEADNKSLFAISFIKASASDSNKKQKKVQNNNNNSAAATASATTSATSSTGPMSIRHFSVLCDVMLGGLCRTLRNIGMDAMERDANTTIEECAEIAKVEGRHILTSGAPYDAFCKVYPSEMCTKLKQDDKRNDQALQIINKFNLQITDEDIFSRCQLCNRDKFLILMGQDMERVHRRKLALESSDEQPPEPCHEILETVVGGEGKAADEASHLRMNDLMIVRSSPDDERPAVSLQFDCRLPPMDRLFFCCSACGKIYWKGGHLSDISKAFASVVVKAK